MTTWAAVRRPRPSIVPASSTLTGSIAIRKSAPHCRPAESDHLLLGPAICTRTNRWDPRASARGGALIVAPVLLSFEYQPNAWRRSRRYARIAPAWSWPALPFFSIPVPSCATGRPPRTAHSDSWSCGSSSASMAERSGCDTSTRPGIRRDRPGFWGWVCARRSPVKAMWRCGLDRPHRGNKRWRPSALAPRGMCSIPLRRA